MKILGKIISCSMIFMLLGASIGPSYSSAANADSYTDEEINKAVEDLKFIFEEATIEDKFGNIIGLNTQKLESYFGDTIDSGVIAEINAMNSLAKPSGIGIMSEKVDRCVGKELKAQYGWIIGTSGIGTLVEFIKAKDYTNALKLLGKLGIKVTVNTSLVGVTAILLYCIYTEEGWI